MGKMHLSLQDGTVFEGEFIGEARQTVGLLSFYTGVVGYQEVITDPANLGKIILFAYPMIGNYGVNDEDAESSYPKASGVIVRDYSPYYSNFRAKSDLASYLSSSGVAFGAGFDTRAILLHLREHGEMFAAISDKPLDGDEVKKRANEQALEIVAEASPKACAMAKPKIKAKTLDFGASRSFYKRLADLGIDCCCDEKSAQLIIVSDAPYFAVEDDKCVSAVKTAAADKPAIGFGHGAAIAAKAFGCSVRRLPFGDHGVNIPVKYVGGGRGEITTQNHIYETIADEKVYPLFINAHDGSCEGFACKSAPVAGVNFMPTSEWFDVLLNSLEGGK